MAIGYIASGGGGGGTLSSDVTAKKENVLIGTSTVTSDSDDEIVEGTMPNIGKVTQNLEVNGSYTIPKGYHDGTGKITQSLNTKGATIYYATTSDQTIAENQYLTGAQTIKKITQTNLVAENIKPGVTINVNNGNSNVFSVTGNMASKAAATYYPTTFDQIIAAGQYLSGAQTIKKLTQNGNLVSGNILRGKTITINNGDANLWNVVGANNVLKYINGSAKGTSNRTTFSLRSGGTTYTKEMYYVDVAPGFTPVFALIISDQTIMWRPDATAFNYVTQADNWDGIYTFVTPSDAPFTSSQCRVFFSRYNSSATTNVWYWIFGY